MNIKIVVLVVFHYVFLSETIFSGVLNDKNVEKLFIKAFKNIYNDKKIHSDEKYERISNILRTIYLMERKKEILLTKQETAKKIVKLVKKELTHWKMHEIFKEKNFTFQKD